MDKENLKVSVIICAYTMERLRDIHDAVESVLAQTFKPYEVIVAVDHNNELFQEVKTGLPSEVKVVLNKGAQGLSETRNVGIRASAGDIISFIDDDAIADKDWLDKLTKPFQDPLVVAVGGKAIPVWHNGRRPLWFPEELDWIVGCTYKGLPLQGNEIRNVPGCNMAFRRDVFDVIGFFRSDIGGIEETPRGGEEAELCLRIKSQMPNTRILYEPSATIYHKVPSWRLNIRYLGQRSYNEGFYKAIVKKLSPKSSSTPLSTENFYLRYLLLTAIPQRLNKFYKRASLSQAGAIIISIAATGVGYLAGKLK